MGAGYLSRRMVEKAFTPPTERKGTYDLGVLNRRRWRNKYTLGDSRYQQEQYRQFLETVRKNLGIKQMGQQGQLPAYSQNERSFSDLVRPIPVLPDEMDKKPLQTGKDAVSDGVKVFDYRQPNVNATTFFDQCAQMWRRSF